MAKNKKKRKIKKTGMAAIAAPILAAGTVAVVSAYQSGIDFTPSGEQQDFQTNQVVFDDNKDTVGKNQDNNDNSSLFEKDQNANNRKNNQDKQSADYLFEAENLPDGVGTASFVENNDQNIFTGETINNNSSSGYNIVADASNADTILPSNPSGNGTGNGSSNGNGNGNGNGNSNGNGSGNTDKPTPTPTPDPTPDDPTPTPDPTPDDPTPDPTPTPGKKWDNVLDPEGEKTKPDAWLNPTKFVDNIEPDSVMIGYSREWGADSLYVGQTITQRMIFNMLDTYVIGKDGNIYAWGSEDFNKYIQIASVSFDGGDNWLSDFPMTISTNGMMLIKVKYRLSTSQAWEKATEINVEFDVESGRILVLSEKLDKDVKQLDQNTIVNSEQYPAAGTKYNLFQWQYNLLRKRGEDPNGYMSYLFQGWEEDGQKVDWFYPMSEKRHILEPMDNVPLKDGYKVKLLDKWLNSNYQEDKGSDGELSYLQSLVGYEKKNLVGMQEGSLLDQIKYKELIVPEYIQSIDIDEEQEIETDYMKIPETVLVVGNTGKVTKGYIVDSQNPNYTVTKDGILMNKKETEIAGIPYEKESVSVPSKVTKVILNSKNKIHTLTLQADEIETIPEIDYGKLSDCKIVVPDSVLNQYVRNNYKKLFSNTGNCVASVENPELTYTVKKGAIVSERGGLRKMMDVVGSNANLSKDISTIQKDAFSDAPNITSIILMKDGLVTFEKGSLNNSNIEVIRCYTQEQFYSVKEQLKEAGGKSNIDVELIQNTETGFEYSLSSKDNVTTATLIKAPEDIGEFDGTIPELDKEEISITEIADGAFENCKELQWVELPESTKVIGYQAFKNCTSLQGLLINAKDSITVNNEAFAGCSSLRFLASNARYGAIDGEYDLFEDSQESVANRYMYIPTVHEGYNMYCTYFNEESGVEEYALVNIGTTGTGTGKMLYGCNEKDGAWIGLQAGKNVDDEVKLPSTTIEIFTGAMMETVSPSGTYTVNWEELAGGSMYGRLFIDEQAFADSDIGGDIALIQGGMISSNAFSNCKNITSVSIKGIMQLSEQIFSDCQNLSEAYIASSDIYFDMFKGCSKLEQITVDSYVGEPVGCVGLSGLEFCFNSDWTSEEEKSKLRVVVPAGMEEDYAKSWRYSFAGCKDYNSLREALLKQYIVENKDAPTTEWLDNAVSEKLLAAENRVRSLMGKTELADTPINVKPCNVYWDDETSRWILKEVASGVTDIDLGSDDLGYPDYRNIKVIGKNAFSKCPNLSYVNVGYSMAEICSNAFEGVKGEITLDMSWVLMNSVNLLVDSPGVPFTFGVDDEKITIILPYFADQEFYINLWVYPFAGYSNLDEMRAAVKLELMESDSTVTDLEVDAEIAERLLPIENRLRKMFGMDEITETSNMTTELKCYSKEEALKQKEEQQKKGETSESGTTDGNEEVSESELTEQDQNKGISVSGNESVTTGGSEETSSQGSETAGGANELSENNKKNEKTLNSGEETKE